MPIIKSAIKRVRQTATRTRRNQIAKRKFKDLSKRFLKLVSEKKTADAEKLFPEVQKSIDLLAKRNSIHKNNAARKKSRFAKMIANAPTPKKTVQKKKTEKSE